MATWGVIIASGKDESVSEEVDTAFLSMGNQAVLGHSLLKFERCPLIDDFIVVVNKNRMERTLTMVKLLGCTKVRHIVAGGTRRPSSLQAGVKRLPDSASVVVIHEASRPAFDEEVLVDTIKASKRYGCAVSACRLSDSAKMTSGNGQKVVKSLDRRNVWMAQTPQSFKRDVLEEALEKAKTSNVQLVDDESLLVEASGKAVHLVPADKTNLKIRTADDLPLMTAIMRDA